MTKATPKMKKRRTPVNTIVPKGYQNLSHIVTKWRPPGQVPGSTLFGLTNKDILKHTGLLKSPDLYEIRPYGNGFIYFVRDDVVPKVEALLQKRKDKLLARHHAMMANANPGEPVRIDPMTQRLVPVTDPDVSDAVDKITAITPLEVESTPEGEPPGMLKLRALMNEEVKAATAPILELVQAQQRVIQRLLTEWTGSPNP